MNNEILNLLRKNFTVDILEISFIDPYCGYLNAKVNYNKIEIYNLQGKLVDIYNIK